MAIRVLGDGCEICNPNYTIEILRDENADLRARCEKAEKDAAYRLDTLKEVRETLEVANVTPDGPINDTIWYSNCETLFDFMDAAIAKERRC